MTVAIREEKYIRQANICKFLSLLYCHPDEELIETFRNIEQEMETLFPEKIKLINESIKDLNQNTLEELKIAHAKLFVGPFDLLAPPFSSVYLDGERRVMGESTMEALEYYRQAGLNPDPSFKQPPDHITTELEFLYYLTVKYLESEDNFWLDLRQEFIEEHLQKWINSFAQKVKSYSAVDLYRNLAALTEEIPDMLN